MVDKTSQSLLAQLHVDEVETKVFNCAVRKTLTILSLKVWIVSGGPSMLLGRVKSRILTGRSLHAGVIEL